MSIYPQLLVAEVLESGAVRPLLDGDGERKLADLPAPLEPPEPGTLMAVRPLDSGTLAPVLTLAAPGTALGRVHRVAAAAGLPADFPDGESAGPMPRMMETTDSWSFDWSGLNTIVATPSGRNEASGNSYRFERDGLSWRLVANELTVAIR